MENNLLADFSVQLTTLAIKGTAAAVAKKIKATKEIKESDRLRAVYDEIVNELLSERKEALRIAHVYRSELDKIIISDEDIKHLQATTSNLLDILRNFSPDLPVDIIEQFKSLISVDTLKVMQLLGFNYKAAIGEPLTEVLAATIRKKLGKYDQVSGKNTSQGKR